MLYNFIDARASAWETSDEHDRNFKAISGCPTALHASRHEKGKKKFKEIQDELRVDIDHMATLQFLLKFWNCFD